MNKLLEPPNLLVTQSIDTWYLATNELEVSGNLHLTKQPYKNSIYHNSYIYLIYILRIP